MEQGKAILLKSAGIGAVSCLAVQGSKKKLKSKRLSYSQQKQIHKW